jgi:F0F1-type ATP synthase assembly protein I
MENRSRDIDKPWWQPALLLFGRLSAWIVAPVLIGAFLGKWLDKQFGTDPWIFMAATGFAFIISMFGLVKSTIEEYKKIEGKSDSKDNSENDNKTPDKE